MAKVFKIIDYFAGTQSVRKAITDLFNITTWRRNVWTNVYEGFTKEEVLIVEYMPIDIYSPEDKNIILDMSSKYALEMSLSVMPPNWVPDFIWFSPPCTAWSIAAISHHWTVKYEGKKIIERIPTSEFAKISVEMVKNTKKIANHFGVPFAIENPRGTLRKHPVFQDFARDTAMYCQYGDTRMKPTDIWSNEQLDLKKCKNGNPCHVAAPRGSRTGTQGLKNNRERSIVPPQLIKEIISQLLGGVLNV